MVEIRPPASETPALDTFEEDPFPEEDPSDDLVLEWIEPVDPPEEQAPTQAPTEEEFGDEVDEEPAVEEDPFATPPGSADLLGRRLLRAGDPATAATELARLSTDPDSDVRMAVARNPATPPELLKTLADDDEHPGVRWWAAAHPANGPETRPLPPLVDPVEIEEEVPEGEAIEVDDRTYVGVNPGPWRYVLAGLAADNAARAWAAANPHTPPDALLALAGDLDPDVAVWVATNPNAPLLALEYLAESEDPLACRAVAANPGTPPHLLALIAARSLAGRLVTDRTPIGCEVPGALVGVARNPNTWPETLAILAEDVAGGVRSVVAGNPSTSPATLEALATDEEIVVRIAVAANPITPPEVLGRLLTDGEPLVRWTAATNPATPLEMLEGFAEPGGLGERVAPTEPLPEVGAGTPAAGEPEETAPESDTGDENDTGDESDTADATDTGDATEAATS